MYKIEKNPLKYPKKKRDTYKKFLEKKLHRRKTFQVKLRHILRKLQTM